MIDEGHIVGCLDQQAVLKSRKTLARGGKCSGSHHSKRSEQPLTPQREMAEAGKGEVDIYRFLPCHRVPTYILLLVQRHTRRGSVCCSTVGSRSKPPARWPSFAHWFSRSCLTTITPNCSLHSCAPTLSRPTADLCRHWRVVDAATGRQGPDDPRLSWFA